MTLDIILILVGSICILAGIAGSILPLLPGIPLSYGGILLLHLTSLVQFSTDFLIFWAIVMVVVQVLDYYIPIWGTRRLGGGKGGTWGATLGVVASIFIFPPWGIFFLPFVGAVLGELIAGKDFSIALKAGSGAFLGFLTGTLIKLVVSFILLYYFVKELILVII